MKNIYINGSLLASGTERAAFNEIIAFAKEPKGEFELIEVDERGYYEISDNRHSNDVFTNVYVKEEAAAYSDGLCCIGTNLYPRLKSEFDSINSEVLDKLRPSHNVLKLVIMGYFSLFELYLMEMTRLFVLFDESNLNKFISFLREPKNDINLYIKAKKDMIERIDDTVDLYKKVELIKNNISELFTYHNTKNLTAFFKNVYDLEIPNLDKVKYYYDTYRHDLMHRYGHYSKKYTGHIDRELLEAVYNEMVNYAKEFDALKNKRLGLSEEPDF